MAATILLKDIVDALQMPSDEAVCFLDLDSGNVETVSLELLGEAEESNEDEDTELPDWQRPEWELAKRIISSDRFLKLPDKFDVHEWEMMQDFSNSLDGDHAREDLLSAIHGRGAFRHFKDTLRRHRIEPAWYAFRDEMLRQIALAWCEENQLEWK